MTIREAKRQLGANLKTLRKQSREIKLSLNYKIVHQILRENLTLLEREGQFARKQLKTARRLLGGEIGTRIFTLCEDTVLTMNDQICQALTEQLYSQNKWLTTNELSLIPDLLKMNLIRLAVMGVAGENADILQSAVRGLHQLKDLDMEQIFSRFSYTEMVFQKDPSGDYPKMDPPTRAYYRAQCAKQAEHFHMNETAYADRILESARSAAEPRARHIGVPLLENARERNQRRARGHLFIGARILLPAVAAQLIGSLMGVAWLSALLYLPLHEIIRPILERVIMIRITPHFMPRMEMDQTIPESHRTLVTVSALLPREEKAAALAAHMERLYLANSNGAVDFCLMADFAEANTARTDADAPAAQAMKNEIDQLNERYGDRFFLMVRERSYIKTQNAYAGWERKRGAILQLVRLIKGEEVPFHTVAGPVDRLREVKYLLALDQDSELLFNSAYELVTAAAHPLNRPVINEKTGLVVKGYGVLVPIIANRIDSIGKSLFSKLFSVSGGVSVYHEFTSNHNQDLFGTSIFCGKGLISVEAYYKCLNRSVAAERVLSHDILEGSFLRCGTLSDVEIADSNPSDPLSWNKRLHRWIRGDFQNVLWILPWIKSENGMIKNPLRSFDRLLMNDNLVRELLPASATLLLAVSFFLPFHAKACVIIALGGLMANGLLSVIIGLIKNGFFALNEQYYSRLIPMALTDGLRSVLSVVTLITDTLLTLSAAVKGLFRQFVSHRHLLEWTTADEVSFASKKGLLAYCYHNALSIAAGAALLAFAPPAYRLFGILFCLCPLIQWRLGREYPAQKPMDLSEEDQKFLWETGKKMWRYYADTCTPEDHYLPPDNRQEQPTCSVAHRTSPTNIGLMMLSAVCAEDLGYIRQEEMVQILSRTFDSVEQLARWNGHLLNWYDTTTLQPLWPRYCSTVDSGNFACCLTAVIHRLREANTPSAASLADRMEQELHKPDFSILYNKHRKLFHIGYDLESQTLSGSYYDMFMSEFRMTGYFAIATRQVPKEHWAALSRTLTRAGRSVGPMSWTGTAFEYLMPPLLLPTLRGTLSYEAIRFCIACQRADAASDQPWGCSESGYYDFDDQLNYQYKPHGISRLALKCLDREERVVSPYSTFLALPFAPKPAMDNLKRLSRLGCYGKYGFYEAVDYTKKRCSHSKYEMVSSYMAHHVGMSLCALENVLRNDRLQIWFMQGAMAGAEALLMEKIPAGAAVYQHLTEKTVPEKPRFPLRQTASWETPHPLRPQCNLLANKELTVTADTTGRIRSKYGDLLVYTTPPDALERSAGFFLYFGELHALRPLTLAPDYTDANDYRCELGRDRVRYGAKNGVLTGEMKLTVSDSHPAEIRHIAIKNRSAHTVKCRVVLYFEPVLHTEEELRSHPAFSKLFLESRFDRETKRTTFKKRARSGAAPAALVAGFAENEPDFTVALCAESAVETRGGRFFFPHENETDQPVGIPNPCCRVSMEVEIAPKDTLRRTFVIAVGATQDEANQCFSDCLKDRAAVSPFFERTVEGKLAQRILPSLLEPCRPSETRAKAGSYHADDLWQAGISGDLPILAMEIRDESDVGRLKPYLDAFHLLHRNGVRTDFCMIYKEFGDYSRKLYGNMITVINNCGLGKKIGKPGGIHLVNTAGNRAGLRKLLLSAARFVVPKDLLALDETPPPFQPVAIYRSKPLDPALPKDLAVSGGYFSADRFVVTGSPKAPWSHILANPQFGTLLTHRSLGFTYAENARENRLTPWSNNSVTDCVGERLILKLNHQYYDLIDGSTAEFAPDHVRYHGRAANTAYQVTVTIEGQKKIVDVQWKTPLPAGSEIAFLVLPALQFDRKHADQLLGSLADGIPVITNPMNTAFRGALALNCGTAFRVSFNGAAMISGDWSESFLPPFDHCCVAGIAPIHRHVVFVLAYGENEETARQNAAIPHAENSAPRSSERLTVSSPDPALDCMINTFLPHQTIASRLYSRTGFYQSSGAFGFRDQLQDAANLVLTDPHLLRDQIILCCKRQFEQGDVLHWWHELPAGPAGVRTRCSDDRLWLPLAVARYSEVTNDWSILDQTAPYLTAAMPEPGRQEQYLHAFGATDEYTVYDHCKRAIESTACSERGLALIGSCDWNDGFSNVGVKGKGESVWLTEFLAMVCDRFSQVAEHSGDSSYAALLRERADGLKAAVETHCWDGEYYTRAYFDDGQAIGSHRCKENRLDLMPQAFAVLADLPGKTRARAALLSAYDRLVDHEHQLIRLFDPPFDQVDAGYISAYPAGLRENGGQYTHGALWLAQALLRLGEAEKAYTLLCYINPAKRCEDPQTAARYVVEPYAVAADIYAHPDLPGRGGWTQYTGSAGWFYRIVVEDLFGIRASNGFVRVQPTLPKALYHAVCRVTIGETKLEIRYRLTRPYRGSVTVPLDGAAHVVEISDEDSPASSNSSLQSDG